MVFDIEADWTLNLRCNYDCSYCIARAPGEHPLVGRLTPAQYLDFLDSTGKTWLLHITGGEPFVHRDFVLLCRTLTTRHFISLNTNLSSRRVPEFAGAVDPSRVLYVHCGVHVDERDRMKGWGQLMENVALLLKRGYALFASLVMTPSAFAHYERVARKLAALGVPLFPKVVRGPFEGRWYPQAYSEAERTRFRAFAEQAQAVMKASPWRRPEHEPAVNPLVDREYLDGFPDFGGTECSAGRKFVSIGYDGRIFRCGQRTSLGNIFECRLVLFPEDRPCNDEYCPYWCLRYSRFSGTARSQYRRREEPDAFQQSLITIRGLRREIGNRIAGFTLPQRG